MTASTGDARSPARSPATRRPALTGIRTVAALTVCLTHAAFWTGHYTDDYVGRLFARFEVGVTIFFVLSGYLLFSPWVRSLQAEAGDHPRLRRYAWHRVRRIVPAYVITVAAVYLIFMFRTDSSDLGHGWSGLVRNLTLTQVYGFGHLHTGLTQMWSLAAEIAYYIALPLISWPLARYVCRDRWRPDLLIAVLGGLLLLSPIWTMVTHDDGVDPTARLWAPTFAIWFVAGMLLAVIGRLVRSWPTAPSVAVAVVAFALSAGAFAGEPTIVPNDAGAAVGKHLLYAVVAVGLIGPLVGGSPSRWSRLCGSRPMVWFGEISYEFFLVHVMVLELVMDLLGYQIFTGSVAVAFLVTTAISVPIAWLLHRATSPLWRVASG
ncbi:acyltransferase family protein [Gordonia sp. (in: high G+C Gram-positive bacteria)]|uniref:acyltransferase family protein n=1 Tax=Gordonia sp. (in: high G+C Gram-positive bacteria) TaxID=84139 RepID=UPI003F9C537B